jgi:hypothetical protein
VENADLPADQQEIGFVKSVNLIGKEKATVTIKI